MSWSSMDIIYGHLPPSNTSSNIDGSSLSSHTLHLVVVKSTKFYVQNLNASAIYFLLVLFYSSHNLSKFLDTSQQDTSIVCALDHLIPTPPLNELIDVS